MADESEALERFEYHLPASGRRQALNARGRNEPDNGDGCHQREGGQEVGERSFDYEGKSKCDGSGDMAGLEADRLECHYPGDDTWWTEVYG